MGEGLEFAAGEPDGEALFLGWFDPFGHLPQGCAEAVFVGEDEGVEGLLLGFG